MFPHMSDDQLDIIVGAVFDELRRVPARVSDTVA
jgi:hypothetical protein